MRRQCCLMKYHATIFFSILWLFANYGRHQAKVPVASYGEAGMKSYFSSIFFTAFVFVFARHAILGNIRTLILNLIFSIQTQISLKLREIEKNKLGKRLILSFTKISNILTSTCHSLTISRSRLPSKFNHHTSPINSASTADILVLARISLQSL